ncbi:MAG TPA: efflux RND transporter permease subunit [Acidobacteriota bacterium]|nr:efflux RND transporter permease subunit [Acidobacteriota bacterium]
MKLVQFSIHRPVTVTMFFVAITVFGVVSYDRLALNLLPEISYPTLTVRTELEGAAPAEIESLLSKPVENVVSVVDNVTRVSSVSKPEVSDVILEFSWNTDMDFASLEVREKLDQVNLPLEADAPILLRYDPSTDPIMRVSVTGSSNLAALRYFCEEFARPDIESIPGVAAARVSGGLEEEIFVELDEERITGLGLSIQDITSRLRQENINLTGGLLREGQSQYLVRTLNEFQTVEEIEQVVAALRNGATVRLGEIADVYSGYKERDIITRVDGEESVEMAIFKAAAANTVLVAEQVREQLRGLEASYAERPNPPQFQVVFDQSRFIKQSIDEVLDTAIYGGILAVVVLFIFLRSLKSTIIIALSIPTSIVATFFLMYAFNISLNIMSLSGLALGIGLLVDNSIVVLESIFRYHSKGYSVREAADLGASEVGTAVVASTMTTICVFAPIVFVEGVAGQLFRDQALTVTFSLVASLLAAVMLIPMLSSLGKGAQGRIRGAGDASGKGLLGRFYLGLLSLALRQRLLSVGIAVVLFAGSTSLVGFLGAELIPEISQGEFFVDAELPPGTPLEETSDRLAELEQRLRDHPEVALFYTIVGSGNQTGVSAVEEREHIGQLYLRLREGILHEEEEDVLNRLRDDLRSVPGVDLTFSRPALFTFKTPVEVIIQGYNLDALKFHAERLKARLEEIPGLRDLRSSTEGGNPELQVRFDRRRLASLGMTVSQGAEILRDKVLGATPTQFNERDRKIDIRVRVQEKDRRSVEDVRNLFIDTPAGGRRPLSDLAQVDLVEGPTEIRRLGPQRVATITGNIEDRDLQSIVEDIQAVLSSFPLPSDFTAFVAGQSEERAVAFRSMQFAILLAVFLVYLVMASQFESLLQPFVIMFSIPFALIGVAVTLFLTDQIINVVVLIGGVVLAGIVVNNSIVLIDYTNRLRKQGNDKFEAVRQACAVRIRPIMMTTSTTVLGLLPMALSAGEGSELRIPLAVTVIGGLIASTLLTLILVPVVYTLVVREKGATP